ncbi:MAG TPA: radical SAM protein [Thermoanaerobaculia bacterium]|nr:radical SAM protein [Thermoanaerobaculia bacterium]
MNTLENGSGTITAPGFTHTTHRVINRRGVMWLGQTCNLRCYFCYFLEKISTNSDPEHPFMDLQKAKTICKTLVDFYGNNSIDIQGGEPTIWPGIHPLVTHCAEIGLKPTLITNGIVLAKKEAAQRLKDAGVYDLLFSIQGLREVYDDIVAIPGGAAKQAKALENFHELEIPFRFNTVLSKPVLPQLDEIAQIAIDSGARVMNFIAFNPFIDQANGGKRSAKNVASYTEIMQYLTPVLDKLDAAGLEVNVRYLPFCMFEERHRKFSQNFQQIVYDLHEWDAASEAWTSLPNLRQAALPLVQPMTLHDTVWARRIRWMATSSSEAIESIGAKPVKDVLHKAQEGAREIYLRLGSKTRNGAPAAPEIPQHADADRSAPPSVGKVGAALERGWQYVREHVMDFDPLPESEALNREARFLMSKTVHPYTKLPACKSCSLAPICDGFHKDYGEMFGTHECKTITLATRVTDPKHYVREQQKIVEEQEYDWALPQEPQPAN